MIEQRERGEEETAPEKPGEVHEACRLLIRNSVVDLNPPEKKSGTEGNPG